MSTEPNPSEAASQSFSSSDSLETTVAMPEIISSAVRSLISAVGDYVAIIAITAILFAIGAVIDLDYVIYASDDDLLVYSLILSAIFAVGIYFLMYGISLGIAKLSTQTVLILIIVNVLIMIVISQIDDVVFASSILTGLVKRFSPDHITTNTWVVRVVQAGITALIVSELNTVFRQSNETRLNIGLTGVVFLVLIGISFVYVELISGVFSSNIDDITDARLRIAGSGALFGAATAGLFLFVFNSANKESNPSQI